MKRVAIFLIALATAVGASAQGRTDYFNVESPQVHPIEIATVAGHPFLVMVNTPDSSIEIWDTDESIPIANRFRLRVRVGLEPVSVRFHPGRSELYTANFLGDSVSRIALYAPTGPGSVGALVLQTTPVGDEPMDLAFHDEDDQGQQRQTLFVTHMMLDGFSWLDALTLEPLSSNLELAAASVQKGDIDGDGVPDALAIKQPRAVAVRDDCVYILGTMGGNDSKTPASAPTIFDFGLFTWDLQTGVRNDIAGLASSNFNLAFADDGDLYVVGHDALNETLLNEPTVAAAFTGFVESRVYQVLDPCGTPTIKSRDVNEFRLQQPIGGLSGQATGGLAQRMDIQPAIGRYGRDESLSLLTDAVVYEPAGGPRKLFFTAMGTDRVGVLEPTAAGSALNWQRSHVDLSLAGGADIAKEGPRGITLGHNVPGTDGASRLYVLNRLGNSFAILNPDLEVELENQPLDHDPRPQYIRVGQRFLYDGMLSQFGFVSCASCHMDARTDGLAWDLGTPEMPGAMIPPILRDFLGGNPGQPTFFPDDKERMVTQSLQGLLNFETEQTTQHLMTNAPYHWRADREDFVAFNEAFAGLLLNPTGEISTPDMESFEEFINSVHYPPNPRQPATRLLSGAIGLPNDEDSGSGAQRGLKVFHIVDSDGRSCNQCHALTEGSNNRMTENMGSGDPYNRTGAGGFDPQPIETAAMRGLFQKEARRVLDGDDDSFTREITGLEGLLHAGWRGSSDQNPMATINSFNETFFLDNFCGPPPLVPCQKLFDLNQFVIEMDWGPGPIIGSSHTATNAVLVSGSQAEADANLAIGAMEAQAELANASVVAHFSDRVGGRRGFWYDVASGGYNEELATGFASDVISTRTDLYNLLVGNFDRLTFTAVPLGNERRVAQMLSPAVTLEPLPSTATPSSLALEGMRANTAYRAISDQTLFAADFTNTPNDYDEAHGGVFNHTLRLFQHGLIAAATNFGFGSDIRHDAPRRLRVSGSDFRAGATLILRIHDDDTDPPIAPVTGRPWNHPVQPDMLTVRLPIHPTTETTSEGAPIWETAVELEPFMYYRLMLGGPYAPGVEEATNDIGPPFLIQEPFPNGSTTAMDADNFNWIWVEVENPDGATGVAGWQRLILD